jgi:hypothetical protein
MRVPLNADRAESLDANRPDAFVLLSRTISDLAEEAWEEESLGLSPDGP